MTLLERRGADVAACLLLVTAALAIFTLTTPPILVNDGEGFDGHEYALMTTAFRDGTVVNVPAPWVHRILVPWLVAQTPLDVKTGFAILGVAASFAAALLVLRLLRRYRAPAPLALLGVAWWLLLAPGPRLHPVFYPVLLDAVGALLLLTLLLAALERRPLLFAIALAAAALTRENLIVLAPLPFFALRERGSSRAALITAAAAVPGVAALLWVHAFPPLVPASTQGPVEFALDNIRGVVTNTYYQGVRFLIAPLVSLGALPLVALVRWRALLALFRREPVWLVFALATAVVYAGAGLDPDRRAYLFAPLLLVVAFSGEAAGLWVPTWRVVALTVLHALATRTVWPIGRDEASYREFALLTMEPRTLARLVVYEVVLAMATLAALVARARRSIRA